MDTQDDKSERSILRLLNPNRIACEERVEREHLDAIRREIALLPLAPEVIESLEQQFESVASMIRLDGIRDALREFAECKGPDVFFAMTYKELERMEPAILRTHRTSVITGLLAAWRNRSFHNSQNELAEYLDDAINIVSAHQ